MINGKSAFAFCFLLLLLLSAFAFCLLPSAFCLLPSAFCFLVLRCLLQPFSSGRSAAAICSLLIS